MPDYGHELRFGVFLTPANRPPEQPVALAQLAESLGYDLATFQDHPYQPAFHDTWTLMSWIAARTERIHLAANVHNMQLRSPAVLARSIASLDLLSGGRIEAALGAGGFPDPVRAMGGPGLAGPDAAQALEEAIPIMRGIWDAEERTSLRVEGEQHHVVGAKRGPAPAHDVPIWLGVLKPRGLRLIGRAADGWLPSYGYLPPGGFAAGSARIDAAALEAGRDPREIRRLLNIGGRFAERRGGFLDGPAESWVDDLLPLVVEQGAGTFILASDDPSTMRRFIEEVAPELRERVAAERVRTGTATGPARGAAALARRVAGIDYEGLPPELAALAVEPGDSAHRRMSANYLRGGEPGLILPVRDAAQIPAALELAGRHRELPFGVRSGGHGISGRSTNTGGLVLDLRHLDGIEVLDPASGRVRIGPGARWADVATALDAHDLALSSGDFGGVGVGGIATAGGIGWLARAHGLTIDRLRAVEVVLADGSRVRASAEEDPELFWGMRGAGGNLGVASSFEFEAVRVGEVGFAQFALDVESTGLAALSEAWGAAVDAAPRELSGQLLVANGGRSAQSSLMVASSDPDEILAALEPVAAALPLVDQSVALTRYAQVMTMMPVSPHAGVGEPYSRSALLGSLDAETGAWLERLVAAGAGWIQFRAVGGAVAEVPGDATAYAGRDASFSLVAMGQRSRSLDEEWDAGRSRFRGSYLSFETEQRPAELELAFPPEHLARLRALKRRVDPSGLFRDNLPVPLD